MPVTPVEALPSRVSRSPAGLRPSQVRELMEPRFGADFGAVRIHADGRAAQVAAALTADALTTGSHIVFAAGRYAPQAAAGQRLLAHELAHVVQRARGAVTPVQRQEAAAPEQDAPGPDADDPLSDPVHRGVPAGYSWSIVVSPHFDSMPSSDAAARLLRDEAAAAGRKKLQIECTTCKIAEAIGHAEEKAPENIPPEKPEVPVVPTTRGFAVEDFHLDRVGYQSLRKGGSVRAIDGIRGGDVEVITRGGQVIRRYTRPDAVSVKSTTITDPEALTDKVIPELDALRGRYEYARGGIEINGLGQRRYDLVFEEGAFAKFTKETLTTLAELRQRAGSIVFRWYINVGGHEFYGPDYLKAQGRELGEP